ncbi:MAG: double-cubane-cluster-containing anaerobic reductase [Syntrophorhabdaceae bacterium]|nr:double-cubane-cluster-containing anaerobic reductase [Syntrophorhabdaceae bacterium]
MEPLINDRFISNPNKRILDSIIWERNIGLPVIGVYCAYAPVELIRAMGAVPACLCAFSQRTIDAAETVLPHNLCPLIKSSFGFIISDACPFYGLSQAIIGETTCDGKKKMFELIQHIKPTHIMDLPQKPDEQEAITTWTAMVHKLKAFLEGTFGREIADEDIEREIRQTNRKNRLMNDFFGYMAHYPPLVNWNEMYDVFSLEYVSNADELDGTLQGLAQRLEMRRDNGEYIGDALSPRVLVTGCPIGGDANKVYKVIEEAGGVIVAMEACSGMKRYTLAIEEGTGDPVSSLARAYLKIPCSCMTPNMGRLEALDALIEKFRPHAVVDVVLRACHSYNIESYKIENHVREKHKIPLLKVETDFSESDRAMIRTRVQAVFENL